MTRKNYVDAADRFGEKLRVLNNKAIIPNVHKAMVAGFWEAVDTYTEHAKADNVNFDRARFIAAVQQAAGA